MTKTLYDLLEVSQTASPESIAACYRRLQAAQAALVGDPERGEDATNQLIALREAYATLSDPVRRQAYDARLAARTADEHSPETAVSPRLRLAVLAVLIGACGLGYAKYQSDREKAALEREQTAAAVRQAEIAVQQEREQAEHDRWAARDAEYQRQREEARARLEHERDLAYGRQVSRDVQRAEQQAERERQREEQRRQREEQQRVYEAERRLAQEKATLRRIEAENARYPRY